MPDALTIGGALASLKAATDLIKLTVGLRDDAAFREKQVELLAKIVEAREALMEAQDERAGFVSKIQELEKQIEQLSTWAVEANRYELVDLSSCFVYRLKPEESGGEPVHWLCAHCFPNRKRSILQFAGRTSNRGESLYSCTVCRAQIRVPWRTNPSGANAPG